MIKVRNLDRENLTMLSNAFLKGILPKGKRGEVLCSKNEYNETDSIYFKDEEYFKNLLVSLKLNETNFENSNASREWFNLHRAILNFENIDSVDYAKVEHYPFVDDSEGEIHIDNSILEVADPQKESFLDSMKRLYMGYDVTYWGEKSFVVVKIPIKPDEKFDFDLKPITELLKIYKKDLETFNIYRDPLRYISVIRIGIKE